MRPLDRNDRSESSSRDGSQRGQLSMPLIEAAVGIVLILALVGLLAVGTPSPQASDPQLDAYAADVGTVLGEEPARHEGTTRLDEISRSTAQFDREAAALDERVDELLPDNLLFRLEVHFADAGSGTGSDGGSATGDTRVIGFERPSGAVTGAETVTTRHGQVRIEVWYP